MRFLPILLASLFVLEPIWAQTNARVPVQTAPPALHLRFLDDARSVPPNSSSVKGFAIQVTDSSGDPVSDAAVAIRLPDQGATGHFPGNLRAWVVYTDSAGVAHFPVIQWEGNVGLAELRASAAKRIAQGELVIQQQVGAEPPGSAPSPAFTRAKGMRPALSPPLNIAVETPEPGTIFAPFADVIPMAVPTSSATAPDMKPQTSASDVTPARGNTTAGTGVGPHSRRNRWLFIAAMCASAGLGAIVALLAH
jgi:hypothetical protein